MAHGVTVREIPTGVRPAVRTLAGMPVYVGVANINAGDITMVNVPRVYYSLAEAVADLGPITPSASWGNWTLSEAISGHFSAYSVGPIVAINVINPDDTDHVSQLVTSPCVLDEEDEARVEIYANDTGLLGVLTEGLVVRESSVGGAIRILDTDYSLSFDDDGYCVITRLSGGAIAEGATLYVSCDYLDPAGVTSADVIGGVTGSTYTGLEVIEQVFPALRLVPGMFLAPTWSQTPTVAARMVALSRSVNGCFFVPSIVDLSTDTGEIANYTEAAAWKSDNGYDEVGMVAAWPSFKNGDDVYQGSTHFACVAGVTDESNGGIPYESPSNKSVTGTAAVNAAGTEILLTIEQANALNAQGIVTFLNQFQGWVLWGNRAAVYPNSTDTKDAMIPVRRMFDWINNTVILTVQRDVDKPGNRRQLDIVVGTVNGFLNGLVTQGALVAGKCEFRADENSTTEMADGHYVFHNTLTPPSPLEQLEFTTEYDPTALAALFP